jgi:hypothetical protein
LRKAFTMAISDSEMDAGMRLLRRHEQKQRAQTDR